MDFFHTNIFLQGYFFVDILQIQCYLYSFGCSALICTLFQQHYFEKFLLLSTYFSFLHDLKQDKMKLFLLEKVGTPRCQINESTRLAFIDQQTFHPTRFLIPIYWNSTNSKPTCLHALDPPPLLGPTCLKLHKISTLLVYLALLV